MFSFFYISKFSPLYRSIMQPQYGYLIYSLLIESQNVVPHFGAKFNIFKAFLLYQKMHAKLQNFGSTFDPDTFVTVASV